ncbi:MAG TPA: multicopper oxidase domain-containing protein [Microbacteriaceae bacterium]|nr:multicopper oxidase domain-containing protein [Microbacteriaceae bacterium]
MKNIHRRTWYLLTNSVFLVWVLAASIAVIFHRFFVYPVWLMVHITLLGAVSSAIYIWSQHFADTLTRRQAPGGRLLFAIRLGAHTAGAVLVVTGMVVQAKAVLLVGASLIVAAALTHSTLMTLQLKGALTSRFGNLVRFYVVAGLWLALGATLGFWVAQLSGDDPLREKLFLAHSAINLFGWIGTTVVGTVIIFLPTVLHARMRETDGRKSSAVLVLISLGTLVAAAGAVLGNPLISGFGLLVWLTGLTIVIFESVRQMRGAGSVSYPGLSIVAALFWLVTLLVALVVMITTSNEMGEAVSRFTLLLPAMITGFIAQLVIGAISYLLPVIMGSPAARKSAETELNRGTYYRITVINLGVALYLLPLPSLAKVSLSLLVFVIMLSFIPFAIAALWAAAKTRTELAKEKHEQDLPNIAESVKPGTKVSFSAQLVTGVGTILLVLGVAIAGDPAAVGITTVSTGNVKETGSVTTIDVHVEGMRFVPAIFEVPVGNQLIVEFTNTGDDTHDITFANGISSKRLAPGESEIVDVGVIASSMDVWCSITGHRAMGMEAEIVALGSELSDAVAEETAGPETPHEIQQIDLGEEPTLEFEPFEAFLQAAPESTLHKITIPVTDELIEVAPGITQSLWSYGGQVPGPVIRGKVGDEFEITLINEGSMGHSIDFHAGVVAPDEPMRTIAPGESLVYNFKAERAGIWMYHCATAPMSAHISNGMFGALIIDPPDLAAVDSEIVLIQSEYYLGEQGGEVDADRISSQMPDLVVFNGYANQYKYRPISLQSGEKVRLWMLVAGPNVGSAFHVIGGQFHTVFKEGDYLLRDGGSTGVGGSQTLDLAVSQGGFVEFSLLEPGNYPFVSHIMSDAEKGALGFFNVK